MDASKRKVIETIISEQSDIRLKGLIMRLVDEFPGAYEHILFWGKQNGFENDAALDEKLALEYWRKAERIIKEFNKYGGGRDRDMNAAAKYLAELSALYPGLSWNIRRRIMDGMLAQYHQGNSGFDDALTDACFAMCAARDEWLYLANDLLSHDNYWNKRLVMKIYKILDDDEACLSLQERSLEYGGDYYHLVQHYVTKQDWPTALTYAWRGLENCKGVAHDLVEFLFGYYEKLDDTAMLESLLDTCERTEKHREDISGKMFSYYNARGHYDDAKRCLLKQFGYARRQDLYARYGDIQNFLSAEDWGAIEPQLLSSIKDRDAESYMRICLQKGRKRDVYDAIIAKSSFYNDYAFFADQLKYDFPEQIIAYYLSWATRLIEGGGRSSYAQSVRYWTAIKEIYVDILHDSARWEKELADIRERYKKRRAFLEEIAALN